MEKPVFNSIRFILILAQIPFYGFLHFLFQLDCGINIAKATKYSYVTPMSQKRSFTTKIESFIFSIFGSSKKQAQKEGDVVMPFSLTGINGDYKFTPGDGRWKIIYFYPKDNTPGCTAQAKTFSTLKDRFDKLHVDILGISNDTIKSHIEFQKKHSLQIELYTDSSGTLAGDFGVKTLHGMCSRDSILINPYGAIEKIYRGVDPKAGGADLLEYIKNQTDI